MVRIRRGIDRTSSDAGSDADAADLATDSTNERRIVGCVHRGKIGNLHGNDVVEDSKAAMNRHSRTQLIGKGNSRLIDKQRRGRKQVVDISQYHFVQRFIGVMRGIKERASHAREKILAACDVRVPGDAHAVSNRGLGDGLIGVHRVIFEIARRNPLFQRNWKALTGRVCRAVGELCEVIEGHRWHGAFAEVVIAHIETPRVDSELPGMFLMRPCQVVIDLPLCDLTALRIGIVIAADRRKRNVSRCPTQAQWERSLAPVNSGSVQRCWSTSSRQD